MLVMAEPAANESADQRGDLDRANAEGGAPETCDRGGLVDDNDCSSLDRTPEFPPEKFSSAGTGWDDADEEAALFFKS